MWCWVSGRSSDATDRCTPDRTGRAAVASGRRRRSPLGAAAVWLVASAAHLGLPPGVFESQATWSFAPGAADERLRVTADHLPARRAPVQVPHRLHAPDTPLWYSRTLDLPADGWLEVEADDGAQVFVGRRQLDQQRRWFKVPADAGGRQPVIVRVLNNAMRGGLTGVRIHPPGTTPPSLEGTPRLSGALLHPESDAFRRRMPPRSSPCRFSAWADSQGGWSTFERLVTMMAGWPSDVSVGVGDLVDDGSNPAAGRGFARPLRRLALHAPVVPVPGNHDYDGFANDLRPRLYLELVAPPGGRTYTAWTCGPVRFVAIDINGSFPVGVPEGSNQARWLAAQVRSPEWVRARWRVLAVHQPPVSRSWAGYHGDPVVRSLVSRLTVEHGLDVVVAGHSHAYERLAQQHGGRTLTVFITGGAGGALENATAEAPTGGDTIALRHHVLRAVATADAMSVEAVDIEGRVFDRTVIER